ncbi:hypothetical protein MC7420_4631 [Coleofasciculus chthonoplastes PCC 7420]|uniref:Uncharacterized protein n=1 Tax=Coleofasciculus chthonoplastes PCC 7420 TaxID=118168 RepID=B4VP55_9CYAN|nr:hypothetical protein MC7420_4631 [Coleofasciculus chthonoplastes PCC 7420]
MTRVGIVLIACGILEFAYFWSTLDDPQCILSSNPSPTSSSPGSAILVVLGVLFLRGNLQIVSLVTWFAALILAYFASNLIRLPFLFPTDFWEIAFRVDPVSNFLPTLVQIIAIAVAFWVYTQLRAAPIVSALVRSDHSYSAPPLKLAFILGIVLVAVPLSIKFFYLTPDSAIEAKAVEIARTEYGEGYKYHVLGMLESNGRIRACLNAYNEQEIKVVPVEWEP